MPGDLIWEDDTSATPAWWLSRANEGARQFVIARDPDQRCLLGIVRVPGADYRVIAVERDGAAVPTLKSRLSMLASAPDLRIGPEVRAWKTRRALVAVVRLVPLALAAALAGGAIGAVVALFAISTGLIGWPMAAVGVALGTGAGRGPGCASWSPPPSPPPAAGARSRTI
jgi:hypothetical protein